MDRIHIKGAQFEAHVGVAEDERSRPQLIVIDLVLWLSTKKAGDSDDYRKAVCYAKVHECVAAVVSSRKFALIEAIAETAAAEVLRAFPVKRVRITVKKPGALAEKSVDYCAVRITRRSGE